jgi:hypothetical protein
MLEVATLQSPNQGVFSLGVGDHHHVDVGFPDGVDDDFLLDYIDFSTCDVPFFHVDDGDILPDLEVDPTELLAEFADEPATTTTMVLSPVAEPAADGSGVHHSIDEAKTAVETKLPAEMDMELPEGKGESEAKGLEEKDVKHGSTNSNVAAADEAGSAMTTDDSSAAAGSDAKSSASAEGHSKRTSSKPASASASAKNSHGRRKVKVLSAYSFLC